MKKSFLVFEVVFLGVWACACGALSAQDTGPAGQEQAGTAGEVTGEVRATTPPVKAAHRLKEGDRIFMGDKIETGEGSQLQIQLLDGTVFRLGPRSTVTVDEFVYDPASAGSKADMVKGVFRAVSGKVAGSTGNRQENAVETAELLTAMDALDQKSREAAQDREK